MRHFPSNGPPALRRWSQFSASLQLSSLPPAVIEKTKLCVVDALSACYTLGLTPEGQQAADMVAAKGCKPVAAIFGSRTGSSAADAAFVNGTSAAGTARSDVHTQTSCHPGSVIVPAVLALAQAERRSGADIICALVAGYEATARLGEALVTPAMAAIHRPTAVVGPTAAGIAAARVLALDDDQTCNAAALSSHSAGGLNEWAHACTSELQFQSGTAARSGVESALMARMGMQAAPTMLDGPAGLLAAFNVPQNAACLTAGLGEELRILDVVHKPAPACIFVQTPCQLARQMVDEDLPAAADIATIEIEVCDAAMRYPGCNDPGPGFSTRRAKMSIQYGVASVFALRELEDRNWADPSAPDIERLASLTQLRENPALTAAYPRTGCRIRVTTVDGRVVQQHRPDFVSMTPQEVFLRFRTAALPHLGALGTEQALVRIAELDHSVDLGLFFQALTALNRPVFAHPQR